MLSEPSRGRARETGAAARPRLQLRCGITTSPVHDRSSLESIRSAASDLEAIVSAFVRDNGLPGASVGLALDSSLAWSAGVGSSDLESGRGPDDRTLYRIASITKTFTATAIMALRDAGSLDLDDPLVRHIPEFAAVRNPFGTIDAVTLRRLLRHSSGLQSEPPVDDLRTGTFPKAYELLGTLGRAEVTIAPDSAWKYSNLGYQLLGEVVRHVSGRSYAEYVRETILGPLGMSRTSIEPGPTEDKAQGYRRRSADRQPDPAREVDPDETGGADALWSSVEDLATWVSFQFRAGNERPSGEEVVLAGSSLAEMHRPVIVSDPELGAAQGLGWKLARRGGTVLVGHGGFTKGFTSQIDFVPDRRLGVIVLLNGIGDPQPASHLTWSLLERVLALPTAPGAGHGVRVADDRRMEEGWRQLVGRYVDPEFGNAARVEALHGGLVFVDVDVDEDRSQRLNPTEHPLRFMFTAGRQAGEPLVFLTRPDGTVDALHAAGYPMVRS